LICSCDFAHSGRSTIELASQHKSRACYWQKIANIFYYDLRQSFIDIDNTLIDFMSMKRAASAAAANAMIEAGIARCPHNLPEKLFTFYLEHGN